jgi:hypothetical protein
MICSVWKLALTIDMYTHSMCVLVCVYIYIGKNTHTPFELSGNLQCPLQIFN